MKRLLRAIDGWQRRNPVVGPAYGVVKKFGDDQASLFVVSLGWYGFTAIYPLLLVVVTVLGYVGVAKLGSGIVKTLHQFPVIGSQFNPEGSSNLHGSVLGLVIGLIGLLYGAQGVTQVAQQAMGKIWHVPQVERPSFLPRIARSLAGLAAIGGAFFVSSFVSSLAVGHGHVIWFRIGLIAGLLVCNLALYFVSFVVLTPHTGGPARQFVPGALLGGIGFTVLTTVGTGLVQHQLRHTTATYGAFASIIGVVTYLLLLAQLSIYAAELNPVIARRLWPRSLTAPPTPADEEVWSGLVQTERRRSEEKIAVEFEPAAENEHVADPEHGAEHKEHGPAVYR